MTTEQRRKIDALVAERVMGLVMFPYAMPHVPDERLWCPKDNIHVCTAMGLPRYSTDIASAWEVFSRWTDATIEKAGAAYHVNINSGYASDKSATVAICLAALRAFGVDDKEWA